MTPEPAAKLSELGLSDSEAAVYLALVGGAGSAQELMKATGQKRPTVYYALGCLERRGLVGRSGKASGSQFALAPAEHLAAIARERAKEAERLADDITTLLPLLTPSAAATKGKPSVLFYEGKEAVSRVVMDMLYARDRHIDILAPSDNFFWQIGPEFVERFVAERKKRGIKTRSLWEAPVPSKVIKEYYEGSSEVRIVPAVMRGAFATSVFIYDDQVLYVSSLKSGYAILMTSREHQATMRAWFEGLWVSAKPHTSRKS